MKLLFLSNFFPPAHCGGYEEWCSEVAHGLRQRGHEVVVLTSRHDRSRVQAVTPHWVVRELYLEMELASLRNGVQFFTHRQKREQANLATLGRLIDEIRPDAILVWGMWNLPRSLLAVAEREMPDRVAYYFGDYWSTLPTQFEAYWACPATHWATSLPKQVLGTMARRQLATEQPWRLDYLHAMFPTAFLEQELRRRGVTSGNSAVVYGGIDTAPYTSRHQNVTKEDGRRFTFLFVGRLTQDKGVHIALEALAELVNRRGQKRADLLIVGSGDDEYVETLVSITRREQIEDHVTFTGPLPKSDLPDRYAQADAFLFTSIWPEPFGRVIVEAMASGLPVIATPTGGAAEILIEEQNALIFPTEDVASLATHMARVMESPALRQQLATRGQRSAVERFDIQRMTAEIESFLCHVVDGSTSV